MTDKNNSMHKGHRQRVRTRFLENGDRIFNTYELLELLLFSVIPYRDTKALAKMLLAEFSDIEGVFSASAEELMRIPGIGRGTAEFLLNVSSLTKDEWTYEDESFVCYDDYHMVGELVLNFFQREECLGDCVAMFAFDNRMKLVGAKKLYSLDFASGGVRADKFIEFALSVRATVAVTAHRHGYGGIIPTLGDKATQSLVTGAFDSAGITHLEHYMVVGGDRYVGMRGRLIMPFAQRPALMRFLESRDKEDAL